MGRRIITVDAVEPILVNCGASRRGHGFALALVLCDICEGLTAFAGAADGEDDFQVRVLFLER